LPTVRVDGVIACATGLAKVEVTPLTTKALPDSASDSVVPDTVIAGAPGASVWPETTKVGPDLELSWLFRLPGPA
jgi:hypothetical protein